MGWFQPIFDFLRQFWPFQIVHSYQSGVRFWLGNDTKELDPGLYAYIPFFGSIEVVDVKPDVMRLASQELTTRDGVGVTLAVNVPYEVNDARAAFCNVQKFQDNIADECRTAVSAEIRSHTFAELLETQAEVEERIADRVADVVSDYGVQIHRVNFADFIRTKSISLSGR